MYSSADLRLFNQGFSREMDFVDELPHQKTNGLHMRKKMQNCTADQRLCFHYKDITIALLLKFKISSF